MALKVNLEGSCFCIITGASKGIGRSLAVECAGRMGPGSLLLLLARDLQGLQQTKTLAETSNVKVVVKSADLSVTGADKLEKILSDLLMNHDLSKFDTDVIIHNAGSVGNVAVGTAELKDAGQWEDYFNLNFIYVSILNNIFLKKFAEYEDRIVVINITSLCAIQPFVGLGMYCIGKAAREMFFKVLAAERPTLKVLNYSPGPVQTDMVQNLIDGDCNPSLKHYFVSSQKENRLLEPEQTAKKCLDVACAGKYTSGDHVDFYD